MRRGAGRTRPAVRALAAMARSRAFWRVSTAIAVGAAVVYPLPMAADQRQTATASAGVPFNGNAAVGALFTAADGKLGQHFCTASVVSSPVGNLLLTAAHCVQGKALTPAGSIVFAPGYRDGRFPYGTWAVAKVYVDPAWAKSQDPDDDVAFLAVGPPGTNIQRHTGAETLMVGQPAQLVQVIGFPDGVDNPITCTARARSFGPRQMVFDCANYTNGTSGGPYLVDVSPSTGDGWVIGVIGGHQQGGDLPDVSYSPRFFASIESLYQTAVAASEAPG